MKKIILILTVLFFISDLTSQSLRSIIKKGNENFQNDKLNEAEEEYLKAIEKNKNEVYGYFNRGDVLIKKGKDSLAINEFMKSEIKTNDKEIKSKINYNIGNIFTNSKNYEKGIEYYKNSLKQNPNDSDARHNLNYALNQLRKEKDKNKNENKEKEKKEEDKKKNEDKNQQKKDNENKDKNGEKKKEEQSRKNEPQKSQISKEDAERILKALNENEKDVQKKLKKRGAVKMDVEKDW